MTDFFYNHLHVYLFVALFLLVSGILGLVYRRTLIGMLVSMELIMNGAGLNLVGRPLTADAAARLDPGAPLRIGMIGTEGHTYMVFQGLKDVPGAKITAYAFEDGDWSYNSDGSPRSGTYNLDQQRKWVQEQPWGKTTNIYETYQEMLDKAVERVQNLAMPDVTLKVMDATSMDFGDNEFDRAIATYTISAVPDPVAVLREMRRVVKPDGILVILNHFRSERRVTGRFEDLDAWLEAFRREGIKHYGPYGHGGTTSLSLYFHDPAGYLFEIGMDAGSWERAKAEVQKRGGLFGSTEETYDIDEWERVNLKKA